MVFGSTPMVAGLPPVAMALQKHIMEHVQIAARERAEAELSQLTAQQGPQANPEQTMIQLESMVAQYVAEGMQQVKQLSQQVTGQGPDPVVQLKQQELQLDAQEAQRDAELDAAKLQLDQQTLQMRDRQFYDRLQAQAAQTQARIDAGRERELLKQRGQ